MPDDLFADSPPPPHAGPYRDLRPPSAAHSRTSAAAAAAVEPHADTLRAAVLGAIRDAGEGGRTRQEVEAAAGLSGNTVRPRVCELIAMGLVAETARTRPTAGGRKAFVLVAAEAISRTPDTEGGPACRVTEKST